MGVDEEIGCCGLHRCDLVDDIKALQGRSSRWRFGVGDYRVVYTVEDGQLIVWVMTVGNRREAYRHL